MSTIVTRLGKGTALTWQEADANFTNLNLDKVEESELASSTGSSMVGYLPNGTGAVNTTVQEKLREFVSVKDVSSTFNSANLQIAADAAYAAGVPLRLNAGVYSLTSDVTIKCAIELSTNVTFVGPDSADWVAPTVSVYFERRMDVTKFTFKNLHIVIAPKDNGLVVINQARVFGNTFYNADLLIGYESFSTLGFSVEGNSFGSNVGRVSDAVTLYNVGNSRVCNNRVRGYINGVKVYSTRSVSCSGIEIYDNTLERVATGICCAGTSMNRISNLLISNNIVTTPDDDTSSGVRAGIYLEFCSSFKVLKNTVSSQQRGIHACAVLNGDIEYNNLTVGGATNPPLYLIGAHKINIHYNVMTQLNTGAYALLAGNGSLIPSQHNNYGLSKISVRGNVFRSVNMCVKFNAGKELTIVDNLFYGSATVLGGAKLLWLTSGCTGRYYDNEYQAVTGNTVILDQSVGGMLTSAPTSALVPIVAPVSTDWSGVTTTASDAVVNSAKSYVVTFKTESVQVIKTAVLEDAPNVAPRDFTAWRTAIPGTKLMINYAPYATPPTGDGYIKDALFNGVLHSTHGVETYSGSRSAVVMDEFNVLSCRDFHTDNSSSLITNNAASVILGEGGYQMACFRPPVVVDGVAYDPRLSGLLGDTTLTSRTGQTYVYLDSVSFLPVTVVNATATASVSGGRVQNNVVVNTGGSGYQVTPSIIITSSNGVGSGATGHAVISGGVVTSVVIDTPGSGYTEAPYIYFGITVDVYAQQISARTCLGQKADGTYVVCTVDGTTNSSGCSLKQLGAKMLALGCDNAYNLDGGGSTALAYEGTVRNVISDPGRRLPSVLYVM